MTGMGCWLRGCSAEQASTVRSLEGFSRPPTVSSPKGHALVCHQSWCHVFFVFPPQRSAQVSSLAAGVSAKGRRAAQPEHLKYRRERGHRPVVKEECSSVTQVDEHVAALQCLNPIFFPLPSPCSESWKGLPMNIKIEHGRLDEKNRPSLPANPSTTTIDGRNNPTLGRSSAFSKLARQEFRRRQIREEQWACSTRVGKPSLRFENPFRIIRFISKPFQWPFLL